jgi:hypothetical protein
VQSRAKIRHTCAMTEKYHAENLRTQKPWLGVAVNRVFLQPR